MAGQGVDQKLSAVPTVLPKGMTPLPRAANERPVWKRWILHHFRQGLPWSRRNSAEAFSRYVKAKSARNLKIMAGAWMADGALLVAGVLSAGFGIRSFLLPNGFIDGGATGISLMAYRFVPAPAALVLFLVNLPFVLIGMKVIGYEFAAKAIFSITGLGLAVAFFPYPVLHVDEMLIAVFGGVFLGGGIGLCVRGGGVIDGTEILAICLSRKVSISTGDAIMAVNLTVFILAACCLSVEIALYGMLTYFTASRTVDFVLEGIGAYAGVFIISRKSTAMQDMIHHELHRGFTVLKGEKGLGKRGLLKTDIHIIYTVVPRLEINRLRAAIGRIDPEAFLAMTNLKDTVGGITKKARLGH